MKKVFKIIGIILLLIGVGFGLISANKMIAEQELALLTIHVDVQDDMLLITEQEILKELEFNNLYHKGMLKSEINLYAIEQYLKNNNEILEAEVYMGLTNDWTIQVKTKRPIARIMSLKWKDFYVNNDYDLMRTSPYSKPKVLVVTGVDALIDGDLTYAKIINNDSLKTKLKLDEIYRISKYVCKDSFYVAQIVQIHYSKEEGIILIPRVGAQKIIFGKASTDEMVADKFRKLTTFYEEVIPYEGWGKYKTINLKFENQIVAKKN